MVSTKSEAVTTALATVTTVAAATTVVAGTTATNNDLGRQARWENDRGVAFLNHGEWQNVGRGGVPLLLEAAGLLLGR